MTISRMIPPLAAMLVLAGCATGSGRQGDAPDWIDGSSERYPASSYVVGIGSADDLATARDRARADLAKTFRVFVDETSTDTQQYSTQDGAAGAASEYSAEVRRDLSLRTQQVLEGVTLPESWQDPASKRHHALAVLSRAQAAARLRQDISGLDAAAETLLNRARAAGDDFRRAQIALDVVENQQRRAALQDALRAVDPTGTGVAPRWPLAQLQADLRVALSRITLNPQGEEPWRGILAGQLADSGFQVSDSGMYNVLLTVDESATKRGDWHWLRGIMVLDVKAPDGRSLGQQRWELKESATDAGTAEMRLREKVAANLAREGRDAILKIVRD
ncbi:MAG TPA: LPP20 family lipoprotein [Gammaproteobacteria bacterium]